jgi:hypothetical protein
MAPPSFYCFKLFLRIVIPPAAYLVRVQQRDFSRKENAICLRCRLSSVTKLDKPP